MTIPVREVVHGDCVEVMATWPEASFDAVVTDPPYGLEFMGKEWDSLGSRVRPYKSRSTRGHGNTGILSMYGRGGTSKDRDAFKRRANQAAQGWHLAWCREALHVLKPGGHLVAFGGTRTFHRLTCAIEDAGWEIRDCLSWLYGSGFPKSLNGEWGGTALRPGWEPIILARKPLDGTVAANFARWGTGGLGIDGCRIEGPAVHTTRNVALGSAAGGIYGSATTPGEYTTPAGGRWPANVALDEVAAAMLDEQSGERPGMDIGTLRRGATTGRGLGYGSSSPSEAEAVGFGDTGGASRFYYCAKAATSERESGLDGAPRRQQDDSRDPAAPGANNPRNRGGRARANTHPTVKPVDLMRWLVRLVTPPGGVVLDPFLGSGTTAIAAHAEDRAWVGIEREEEYVRIARARIAAATAQGRLFAPEPIP